MDRILNFMGKSSKNEYLFMANEYFKVAKEYIFVIKEYFKAFKEYSFAFNRYSFAVNKYSFTPDKYSFIINKYILPILIYSLVMKRYLLFTAIALIINQKENSDHRFCDDRHIQIAFREIINNIISGPDHSNRRSSVKHHYEITFENC